MNPLLIPFSCKSDAKLVKLFLSLNNNQPIDTQAKKAHNGINTEVTIKSTTSSRFLPYKVNPSLLVREYPKDIPTGIDKINIKHPIKIDALTLLTLNIWVISWITTSKIEITEVIAATNTIPKNKNDQILTDIPNVTKTVGRELNNKTIPLETIVKIQHLTIKLFEAQDDDYPDGRVIKVYERNIKHHLDKITNNESEQDKILQAIEQGNWDPNDLSYKPICDRIRALGFEVIQWGILFLEVKILIIIGSMAH